MALLVWVFRLPKLSDAVAVPWLRVFEVWVALDCGLLLALVVVFVLALLVAVLLVAEDTSDFALEEDGLAAGCRLARLSFNRCVVTLAGSWVKAATATACATGALTGNAVTV